MEKENLKSERAKEKQETKPETAKWDKIWKF